MWWRFSTTSKTPPSKADLQKIHWSILAKDKPTNLVQNEEYLENVRTLKYSWDEEGTFAFLLKLRHYWHWVWHQNIFWCILVSVKFWITTFKIFASLPQAAQLPRNLYETPKMKPSDVVICWWYIVGEENDGFNDNLINDWLIEINEFGGDVILRLTIY